MRDPGTLCLHVFKIYVFCIFDKHIDTIDKREVKLEWLRADFPLKLNSACLPCPFFKCNACRDEKLLDK